MSTKPTSSFTPPLSPILPVDFSTPPPSPAARTAEAASAVLRAAAPSAATKGRPTSYDLRKFTTIDAPLSTDLSITWFFEHRVVQHTIVSVGLPPSYKGNLSFLETKPDVIRLSLWGCQSPPMEEEAFQNLHHYVPNLKELNMGNLPHLPSCSFLKYVPKLTYLSFKLSPPSTNFSSILQQLEYTPSLETLDLSKCPSLTLEDLQALKGRVPNLKKLWLHDCPNLAGKADEIRTLVPETTKIVDGP